MDFEKEEYYDKLRVILKVLSSCRLEDWDRDTLTWVAIEYLEKLGEVTGIVRPNK